MELGATTAVKRYEELGLADALARHYDYPCACHELSLILKLAYSKLPKPLQSLIFRDTLSAFRLLPQVQTKHAISAANLLVQAVEASLPKQKRTLAVSEFKHAMVEHKRQGKARQDGVSMQLPQDALVHVFSFLDLQSLINASSVCWAWNTAGDDNMLWRMQYSLLFGDVDGKTKVETCKLSQDKNELVPHYPVEGEDAIAQPDSRETFKRKYKGLSSKLASHRAICGHCKSMIWLRHPSARSHHCSKLEKQGLKLKPLSPYRVVDYLLGETNLTSSSDSDDSDDSDSDDALVPTQYPTRLWAFPRLVDNQQ